MEREEPKLSKSILLGSKSSTSKLRCLLVHNAHDEADSATNFESDCRHVQKARSHTLLNKKGAKQGRITLASWDLGRCIAGSAWGSGPIYISFQSHGAPGWTLGANGTALEEYKAALRLLSLRNALQVNQGQRVCGIVLRSCYSGVECYHNGRFMLSSARLVSILMPDLLVVGYFGSDNGSTTVTGLCSDTKLSLDAGTVCFFAGKLVEGTERPTVYAPVLPRATKNELVRLCDYHGESLPLKVIPEDELPEMMMFVNHLAYLAALDERRRMHRSFRDWRSRQQRERLERQRAPVVEAIASPLVGGSTSPLSKSPPDNWQDWDDSD